MTDDPFETLILWFCDKADDYAYPLICNLTSNDVIEVEVEEELDPEDEERFVEIALATNNLAELGTIVFCRHPEHDWRVIAFTDEGTRFFRLVTDPPGLDEEPRPDFWALDVAADSVVRQN